MCVQRDIGSSSEALVCTTTVTTTLLKIVHQKNSQTLVRKMSYLKVYTIRRSTFLEPSFTKLYTILKIVQIFQINMPVIKTRS